MNVRIHPTAEVSDGAHIGEGTSIWNHAQVRENTSLGKNCVVSKGVYIDFGVSIGDNVKIQNYVSVYHGVTIKNGVFVGPHVCFTNDLRPRAINPDGTLKSADDWVLSETIIEEGAALGANSTIVCGVTIGKWAMIGSGSVVTRDIPNHGLAWGNPARIQGFVCACGNRLAEVGDNQSSSDVARMHCVKCHKEVIIPREDYQLLNK
ncbi:MAG: N-acetyltransferase [Anaerolineae bacterium]|nr:N-acetyltransferase [Anaerolineae bacterium]